MGGDRYQLCTEEESTTETKNKRWQFRCMFSHDMTMVRRLLYVAETKPFDDGMLAEACALFPTNIIREAKLKQEVGMVKAFHTRKIRVLPGKLLVCVSPMFP